MSSWDSRSASDVSDDGSATFKCKYCPRSYPKTQALSGHQNAHRREREITERQQRAILAHVNQPDPNPYPNPYVFPIHNALTPGFEQPLCNVNKPDSLAVGYNQRTRSSSSDHARLQIHTSQGLDRGWTITENPYQPLLSAPSPVSLDLCLGVGSSSQAQTRPKEPNDALAANQEDDDLSLKL
ncbi:hypothetical protein EUTSA_v10015305mg [Eutrema salsugineum]|uniref:C2H2-type domain-containing protein n=1 Tax=Eutrema salsugineum TaxID=72664 RepID=V4L9R9_EUTSA|nr:uncharacterized protein LOC18018075 [Eutrema salsugineum]ESQ40424.1 hypothetical protein EUTSA_v10015305mg [Eutrema salsugineum]